MFLTHYNLLLKVKITRWVRVNCLFLVTVSKENRKRFNCSSFEWQENLPSNVRILMVQILEEFIPIYYLPCSKTYLIVSSLMVVPNDISRNKLHTTRPLDLENKFDISNVFKSFGIAKIVLSSVFSGKDLELQNRGWNTWLFNRFMCLLWLFIYIKDTSLISQQDALHQKEENLLWLLLEGCHLRQKSWHHLIRYILTKLVHFY